MYNVRRTWDEPRKCPGHAAFGGVCPSRVPAPAVKKN